MNVVLFTPPICSLDKKVIRKKIFFTIEYIHTKINAYFFDLLLKFKY